MLSLQSFHSAGGTNPTLQVLVLLVWFNTFVALRSGKCVQNSLESLGVSQACSLWQELLSLTHSTLPHHMY